MFASPDYIAAHGLPETNDQLSEHTWVIISQVARQKSVELFENGRDQSFKAAKYHECDSPNIQRLMLENGFGIGLHLPSLARASVAAGRLVNVLPNHHSLEIRQRFSHR